MKKRPVAWRELGVAQMLAVKALQGCGGFPSRAIKKRQLYLGIRTDDERFFFGILLFFFCHLFDCLLVDYL